MDPGGRKARSGTCRALSLGNPLSLPGRPGKRRWRRRRWRSTMFRGRCHSTPRDRQRRSALLCVTTSTFPCLRRMLFRQCYFRHAGHVHRNSAGARRVCLVSLRGAVSPDYTTHVIPFAAACCARLRIQSQPDARFSHIPKLSLIIGARFWSVAY